MKSCLRRIVTALLHWPMPAYRAAETRSNLEFDSVADFLKLPEGMNFGEVRGGGELEGPLSWCRALEQRQRTGARPTAAQLLEFDPRAIRPRNRQGPLRLVVRPHRPRRSRRQHLGGRQGLGHGHQVQPAGRMVRVFGRRRSADDETRPGNTSTRRAAGQRTLPQPTDVAWDPAVTSTSPTVTSIRAWRRRQRRRLGEVVGRPRNRPGQFDMPHDIAIVGATTSTSPIAATAASRCLTPTEVLRMFTVDVPVPPGHRPRSNGNTPTGSKNAGDRRSNSLCTTPGPQPGDVPRRKHVPRTAVQGDARRQGARRDRGLRTEVQAVLRGPRACVSVGNRGLRGGNVQLAGAEVILRGPTHERSTAAR